MEARSGQNYDTKLHYKSVLIPLQQMLWTCCIFLSSINNTFFSVLVIIFSNMSYFCFNYTNTFFIHTMNYFSVVLRIIFLMCIVGESSLVRCTSMAHAGNTKIWPKIISAYAKKCSIPSFRRWGEEGGGRGGAKNASIYTLSEHERIEKRSYQWSWY